MPTTSKGKKIGRPKGSKNKHKHQPSGEKLFSPTVEKHSSDVQLLLSNRRKYTKHKKNKRKCVKCHGPLRYSSISPVCELCLTRQNRVYDMKPSPGGPKRWWSLVKLKEGHLIDKAALEKIFGSDLLVFQKGRDINKGKHWSGELLVEKDGKIRHPRPGYGDWNCVFLKWVEVDE